MGSRSDPDDEAVQRPAAQSEGRRGLFGSKRPEGHLLPPRPVPVRRAWRSLARRRSGDSLLAGPNRRAGRRYCLRCDHRALRHTLLFEWGDVQAPANPRVHRERVGIPASTWFDSRPRLRIARDRSPLRSPRSDVHSPRSTTCGRTRRRSRAASGARGRRFKPLAPTNTQLPVTAATSRDRRPFPRSWAPPREGPVRGRGGNRASRSGGR